MELIILALVQGITEFLPISSSGHLILLKNIFFLNLQKENIHLINIILHFGTMLSILTIFWKEIKQIINNFWQYCWNLKKNDKIKKENLEKLWLLILIIISSIPTAIIGLTLRKMIKMLESNIFITAIALLITGSILILSYFAKNFIKKNYKMITIIDAIILGIAQGIAIIPGISRSGITITTALFLKIDQKTSGFFSFLMSIPIIFGAMFLELFYLEELSLKNLNLLNLFIGLIISFIIGYVTLKILLKFINKGKLYYFSCYCYFISILILIFF